MSKSLHLSQLTRRITVKLRTHSLAVSIAAMSIAVEGPYTAEPNNPVLIEGEKGEWDDGGFSEAEVFYSSGLFHMFYGGAKTYEPRILTRESIGYAYSEDGRNWTEYGGNPIATREADPNAVFNPSLALAKESQSTSFPSDPGQEPKKSPKIYYYPLQMGGTLA